MTEKEWLYMAGEESLMMLWENTPAGEREQSERWKKRLLKQLGKEEGNMAGKHTWYGRGFMRVAVAVGVLLISSLSVYAAVRWIHEKAAVYNETSGEMTYIFEAPEGMEIRPMILQAEGEMPEGFYLEDTGKLRVLRKSDDAYAAYIQQADNHQEKLSFDGITAVEDRTVDGHEAKLLKREYEEADFNEILIVLFQEDGQIVEIGYDNRIISAQQVEQIVSDLKFEAAEGEAYEPFSETAETASAENSQEIYEEQFFEIGEAAPVDQTIHAWKDDDFADKNAIPFMFPYSECTITVTSYQVMDTIRELDERGFNPNSSMTPELWTDTDGRFTTFPSTEEQWTQDGPTDVFVKESTPGLFYITVRIENTTDTVMEIPFDIRLAYLEEKDGAYYTSGALKAKVDRLRHDCDLFGMEGGMQWFDGNDFSTDGKGWNYISLEPGEVKEVHCGLPVVLSDLEDAYLQFTNTDTRWANFIKIDAE